ncbi:MAG: M15 family metallopeptidase, partial [Candidatus Pacebacteria bacterium]|nr:M15 family metallopeptidase [Candidatus Paceibacterota bacterium]MBP9842954.1 M15 family metallopeptidase [Candidatus Paceibacterota bacterium]
MKPLILLTLTLSVFFGVLAPSTSLAQTPNPNQDTFYENGGPTINGGNITSGGFVPCSGAQCSLCDFAVMANTIIKWLIGIIFLFFAILAVYAGFKLVTSGGNSGAKQAAKNSFTNAFIGLFIVLAAWILIDTLLRAVLKGGNGEVNGYGPWAEIQCASQVVSTVNQLAVGDPDFELASFVSAGGEESGVVSGGSGNNCPAASPEAVVTIPGTPFKALPHIANNFVLMRDAAKKNGIVLNVTSGWRSEQNQVYIFNKLCPSGTCGATKAARPCSMGGSGSNHNSGLAIDISVGCNNGSAGCNTATYRWLKSNGGRYGFNNALPTDPVHWSPSGR